MTERTEPKAPLGSRPRLGWEAWEATVGHIYKAHSADAALGLHMYPLGEVVAWSALLSWGQNQVQVADRVGLAVALSDLWTEVDRTHQRLLATYEAVRRRPAGYSDDEWLDPETLDMISRLVGVTATVFQSSWRIILTYRPLEQPEERVKGRLIAYEGQIGRGGQGATLREACRALYHNAIGDYVRAMRASGADIRLTLKDD